MNACSECGKKLIRCGRTKTVYSTDVPGLSYYTIFSLRCPSARFYPFTSHDVHLDQTEETEEYKAYKKKYDKTHQRPLPSAPSLFRLGGL